MARRFSTIKKIEKEIANANALPTANIAVGARRFVASENTTYKWTGDEWVDTELNFDLSIAPEVLSIQVDAPTAGHGDDWLWTWEQSTLPYARTTITNSAQLSVPLYKQGTYTIDNYAAYDLHDSMTQTHKLFLKWIDGAGTQNLVDWVTYSNVTATHANINSGLSTNVHRLSVSVPSSITLPTLTAPNVSYTIANTASSAYTFTGTASGSNPSLGPWRRGGTYVFNINANGHPMYLSTDNGTNYVSNQFVSEYTNGVSNSRTESGIMSITVPDSAPDTLYYQCGYHAGMRGVISIKNLEVETNDNDNYVIYAQHTQEGHKTPVELRPIPSLVNQMCLVYDAENDEFVPQDLATYVENTPSFKNKIKEVAGTATLIAPDGVPVVATVNIFNDSSYLPYVDNNDGDIAFALDTEVLYIWNTNQWIQAGSNTSTQTNAYVQLVQAGTLEQTTGNTRWYAPADITITNVIARVGTAPVGADLVVDLNRNGTSNSIVTVSDGDSLSFNASSISASEGDYLTIDINSVGSTTAGSDLNVTIKYLI